MPDHLWLALQVSPMHITRLAYFLEGLVQNAGLCLIDRVECPLWNKVDDAMIALARIVDTVTADFHVALVLFGGHRERLKQQQKIDALAEGATLK